MKFELFFLHVWTALISHCILSAVATEPTAKIAADDQEIPGYIPRSEAVDSTVLKPIHIRHYSQALGRRSLDAGDLAHLNPVDELELVYGTRDAHGRMFLAHVRLRAPPNTRLISMETFDNITTAVDCSTVGDGKIALHFKDDISMRYAIYVWDMANPSEDHKFIMIANARGCGMEDQRTPYLVMGVDFVDTPGTWKANVYATELSWDSVLDTYEVNYGHVDDSKFAPSKTTPIDPDHPMITPMDPRLDPRLCISCEWDSLKSKAGDVKTDLESKANNVKTKVESAVQTVKDSVESAIESAKAKLGDKLDDFKEKLGDLGTGDISNKTITMNVTSGTPNTTHTIWPIVTTTLYNNTKKVECIDCYSKGVFTLIGSMAFENFQPKKASYNVTAKDFEVMLKFRCQFNESEFTSIQFNIMKIPITALGAFEIPKILTIGPNVRLEVNLGSGVGKTADFTLGWHLTLPDTATMQNDMMDNQASTGSGFDDLKLTALPFTLLGGEFSMTMHAQFAFVIAYSITATPFWGYELSAKLLMPNYTLEFTTETNPDGVCGTKDHTTALKGVQTMNFALTLYRGKVRIINPTGIWGNLVTIKVPLDDLCIPIEDERGGANGTSSALPASATGLVISNGTVTNSSSCKVKRGLTQRSGPLKMIGIGRDPILDEELRKREAVVREPVKVTDVHRPQKRQAHDDHGVP